MKKMIYLPTMILTFVSVFSVYAADDALKMNPTGEKQQMQPGKENGDQTNLQSMTQQVIKKQARVVLKPTKKDSSVQGEGSVLELNDGTYFMLFLDGVPKAGKHGIHVYENGSCEDNGNAAGGHYNPDGVKHGDFKKDGPSAAHVGDLGNIVIDENGKGELHRLLSGVTIEGGKYNVAGRAIILDENEDDFQQPPGNAGEKIGCGVIELLNK